MIFFTCLWLTIGFYIVIYGSIKSRNKKIKPTALDSVLTVFLWPFYLVQVLIWRATLSEAEMKHLYDILNEEEKPKK